MIKKIIYWKLSIMKLNEADPDDSALIESLENAKKDIFYEPKTEIVEKKIPVREIESISVEAPKKNKLSRRTPSTNEYKYAEDMLREKLDTKVKIKDNKIQLYFTNIADLNRILDVIGSNE